MLFACLKFWTTNSSNWIYIWKFDKVIWALAACVSDLFEHVLSPVGSCGPLRGDRMRGSGGRSLSAIEAAFLFSPSSSHSVLSWARLSADRRLEQIVLLCLQIDRWVQKEKGLSRREFSALYRPWRRGIGARSKAPSLPLTVKETSECAVTSGQTGK